MNTTYNIYTTIHNQTRIRTEVKTYIDMFVSIRFTNFKLLMYSGWNVFVSTFMKYERLNLQCVQEMRYGRKYNTR